MFSVLTVSPLFGMGGGRVLLCCFVDGTLENVEEEISKVVGGSYEILQQ